MRETYSLLVQEFEERHLPVLVERDPDDKTLSDEEKRAKCYLAVDDRLEYPPVRIMWPDLADNFDALWTYLVDLDHEVLAVDQTARFKLSNIPRNRRWIRFLKIDHRRRRTLRPSIPQEFVGSVFLDNPQVDEQAKARYKDLNIQIVCPKIFVDVDQTGVPRQYLLLATFASFYSTYKDLLDSFILEWKPDDITFRELAFAVLSLAAGEVLFDSPQTLDRSYGSEGYYLVPDKKLKRHPGRQKLIPHLLSERHLPGIEPGSAPAGTVFWFENVLVYLASRLDLVDVEEAAVAQVVAKGLDQGLKNFQALVFSILDFVLIQVRVEKDGTVHVSRSPLMNLFYFNDTNSVTPDGPRSRVQFETLRTAGNSKKKAEDKLELNETEDCNEEDSDYEKVAEDKVEDEEFKDDKNQGDRLLIYAC